jgi:hypothetical protein
VRATPHEKDPESETEGSELSKKAITRGQLIKTIN